MPLNRTALEQEFQVLARARSALAAGEKLFARKRSAENEASDRFRCRFAFFRSYPPSVSPVSLRDHRVPGMTPARSILVAVGALALSYC